MLTVSTCKMEKIMQTVKHDAVEQNYMNQLSLYIFRLFWFFLLLTKISEYVSIQLTIYTQPEDNHNKFEVYTLYSYSVTNKGVIKSHKTLLQGNDKT